MRAEYYEIEDEFPSSNDISQLSDFKRGRRTSCHAIMSSETESVTEELNMGDASPTSTINKKRRKGYSFPTLTSAKSLTSGQTVSSSSSELRSTVFTRPTKVGLCATTS